MTTRSQREKMLKTISFFNFFARRENYLEGKRVGDWKRGIFWVLTQKCVANAATITLYGWALK